MNDTQRSKAVFIVVSHLVILGVIVPVCVLVLIVTFSFCYAECSDTGASHIYCSVEWSCDECQTFLTVMLSAVILKGIILTELYYTA
jgi:hypothetical protein